MRLPLLLGAAVALSACAGDVVRQSDLVPLMSHGERMVELAEIRLDDIGSSTFGFGWSRPERDREGKAFRWAEGPTSELRFFSAEPRQLTLCLELVPFSWSGAPPQGVEVSVNGTALGHRSVVARYPMTIDVPAEIVLAGTNQIELRWNRFTRVADVRPSSDRRELAAKLMRGRIEGLAEGPGASFAPTIIAPASETRVAALVGEDAELTVTATGGRGLEVWWHRDDFGFVRLCGPCDDRPIRLGELAGPAVFAFRNVAEQPVTIDRARVAWSETVEADDPVDDGALSHDVILYVVDTLREDRLGYAGGPKGISPAVDALAADGVIFANAVAQSSWTKPSVVSILTGLRTTEHGIRSREPVLPDALQLVSEVFQDAGFVTGAFTTNAYLTANAGFNQGFDVFEFAHIDGHSVTRRAAEWLTAIGPEEQVFLWVHTIDPHAPYQPSLEFRERWAAGISEEVGSINHVQSLGGQPVETTAPFVEPYRRLYDAEVAQNDAAFGELVRVLKATDRYDRAAVVFVSDHGEAFWERGVNGHGWDLFEEVLDVPLVIKSPTWPRGGVVRRDLVEHRDIVPTLVEMAGVQHAGDMAGRSLLYPESEADGMVFAEMAYDGREGFAVQWRRFKLIQPLSPNFLPRAMLFDLASDPDERRNVSERHPATAAWLTQEGRRSMAGLEANEAHHESVALDDAERTALEALGYLDAH